MGAQPLSQRQNTNHHRQQPAIPSLMSPSGVYDGSRGGILPNPLDAGISWSIAESPCLGPSLIPESPTLMHEQEDVDLKQGNIFKFDFADED